MVRVKKFFFGPEILVFGRKIQFLPYDPNFGQRSVCSPRRDLSFARGLDKKISLICERSFAPFSVSVAIISTHLSNYRHVERGRARLFGKWGINCSALRRQIYSGKCLNTLLVALSLTGSV